MCTKIQKKSRTGNATESLNSLHVPGNQYILLSCFLGIFHSLSVPTTSTPNQALLAPVESFVLDAHLFPVFSAFTLSSSC